MRPKRTIPPPFKHQIKSAKFLQGTNRALDASDPGTGKTRVAIDFKTGRKHGNEVAHSSQIQLYQLVSFLRFPDLQTITGELWYLDQDELTSMRFTRAQGLRVLANYERRGLAMTTATEFPAKPSIFACRWCAYNTDEHCSKGVRAGNPNIPQGPKRKFR